MTEHELDVQYTACCSEFLLKCRHLNYWYVVPEVLPKDRPTRNEALEFKGCRTISTFSERKIVRSHWAAIYLHESATVKLIRPGNPVSAV